MEIYATRQLMATNILSLPNLRYDSKEERNLVFDDANFSSASLVQSAAAGVLRRAKAIIQEDRNRAIQHTLGVMAGHGRKAYEASQVGINIISYFYSALALYGIRHLQLQQEHFDNRAGRAMNDGQLQNDSADEILREVRSALNKNPALRQGLLDTDIGERVGWGKGKTHIWNGEDQTVHRVASPSVIFYTPPEIATRFVRDVAPDAPNGMRQLQPFTWRGAPDHLHTLTECLFELNALNRLRNAI